MAEKQEKKHTTQESPKNVGTGIKDREKQDNKSQKITELTKKIQDLTSLSQRLQADFENYKKRVEKERPELCRFANAELVLKLLPILDSFELGLRNHENKEEFTKGVELIFAQLFDVLEGAGLRKIECKNKKFDPYFQEALIQQKSDGEEGIILEELQKGYLFNNKLLRTAKVKISSKMDEIKKEGKDDKNN